MGTSDMNSTPPATTASHWLAAIRPAPGEMDKEDEDERLKQPLKTESKIKELHENRSRSIGFTYFS